MMKHKIKLCIFYLAIGLSEISFVHGAQGDCESHILELRASLYRQKIHGFLVPYNDEYQSEALPPANKRLEWLTGFTGSAGVAIITEDKAVIVVDGRYVDQARQQVPQIMEVVLQIREGETLYDHVSWLRGHMAGKVVGYDSKLFLHMDRAALEEVTLQAVPNLVDMIWGAARPSLALNPIVLYPEVFAGNPAREKIVRVRKNLKEEGVDAVVILDPDSIAWLFNVRGSDVAHTPVILASLLLEREGAIYLVTTQRDPSLDIEGYFSSLGVSLCDSEKFEKVLRTMADRRVLVDHNKASVWLVDHLGDTGAQVVYGRDPSWLLRVRKNPVEIEQMKLTHVCDGAALCEFLAWFDRTVKTETLTEKSAAEELWKRRQAASRSFPGFEGKDFLTTVSFPTISAFGPHAAHPHYTFLEDKDRGEAPIAGNSLYLNDSGAQYRNGGTTDITRTVAVGEPTEEQRDRFTRVLKGHIALETAVFPRGTIAATLDPLARKFLKELGLDYNHGTSHGVGAYLAVHESPGSWLGPKANVPLEEGMVLSNEPGYYKKGEYGIRIENVMVSVPAETDGSLTFKTISLAPIDRRLVDLQLLTLAELEWLNAYHLEVRNSLSPYVSAENRSWFNEATSELRKLVLNF